MGDALKKVQAGQRLEIPAEAYNAFIDAARAERARRHSLEQDASGEYRQTGIIKIRNHSGSDQDRYHVLALGDPIISPTDNEQEFKNRVSLSGVTPTSAARSERFAVLLDPLSEDAIGRGVVSGVVPIRINVIRESDDFAELVAGETSYLRSTPQGLTRILWKEPGLGIKWAVIRLSERPRLGIFQLSGSWQAAESPDPAGWMKMTGCRPVFYSGTTETYAADTSEATETIWHAVGYPPSERAAVISLHQATGLVPAKLGCGDWVWCLWNESESRWQALVPYEDHWRFKLLTPLPRCGSASAQLVLYQSEKWCPVSLYFTVHDSVGVVCPTHCQGAGGTSGCECSAAEFAPAGTYGVAKHYADSCKWEVLALGEGCCESGSSSSSGSASSSGSSSSSASPSSSSSRPSSSSGSGSVSSSSYLSSSSSGSNPQSCVTIYETDVRCEGGKLNVYARAVSICLSNQSLTRYEAAWIFSHQAGCCCCDGCSGSSSGSSSSSSLGTSSSSATSMSSSSISASPSSPPTSSAISGPMSSSGQGSSGPTSSAASSSLASSSGSSSSSTAPSGSSTSSPLSSAGTGPGF